MSSTALFRTESETGERAIERDCPIEVNTSLGTVSLRVTSNLASLESVWEKLQASAPCSAAQTYGWARAWTRHVLGPPGDAPVIVVGSTAEQDPLFLWPFEIGTVAGLTVLKWLGQSHANYTMGLFDPRASTLTADDLNLILEAVARETGAAAAMFKAQPFTWDGVENPFARLPFQPAPDSGYAITLGDYPTLYKARLSKHARANLERTGRRLCESGTLTWGWTETREERLALLDIFFAQKSRQFAEMGIDEVFDAPARAFYREIALLEEDNPSRLRIGYLKRDDEVLATHSGTICHERLLIVLSSRTDGELRKYSPGAFLLQRQIEEACAMGLAFYDIGAGAATYKEKWCDAVQPLFDSFIAFKAQGLALTVPLAIAARLKRAVKSQPRLRSWMQQYRRRVLGRGTLAD